MKVELSYGRLVVLLSRLSEDSEEAAGVKKKRTISVIKRQK
jgi:hypothetical protein